MSIVEKLSTYDVIDSRIILDPKSITASDASEKEAKRNSLSLDLEMDFPTPSGDTKAVPVTSCDLQVYKRRWYILLMFALLDSLQALVWLQFGPIASATEHAYGWKNDTIALFANWGPITYIPTALLWSWVVDKKGLRTSTVGAAALMVLGTGIRCISGEPEVFTYLVHAGQILNGLAGPIAMGAVPKVSAVWFPEGERTTATSAMHVIVGLGLTAAFYVGPALVPELKYLNSTDCSNYTRNNLSLLDKGSFELNSSLPTEEEAIQIQRQNVMYYMYGTFAVCGFYFLVLLIYFPSSPPKPPSPSASSPRMGYLPGLKALAKNGRFWQIAIAYGVSTGTRDAWGSMMNVNLKDHGISQTAASYLGIFGTLGGIVSSLVLSRVADYMRTRHKLFLVVLYALTSLSYLWMVLLIVEIIPSSMGLNGRFWQIAIAYGVSTGTRDAWGSMMNVNLKDHGISQTAASYLGIFGTLGGIVSSLVLSRVADYMRTRHKLFLVVLYALTSLSYLWMVLLIVEIIPSSMVSMYIAYGFVDLASACTSPLFYETVCEITYPVAEGVTNVSLTTQNNIAALIFLGLFSVPNIGTVWMNWTLIGAFSLAFILLVLLPVEHHRLDVDIKIE